MLVAQPLRLDASSLNLILRERREKNGSTVGKKSKRILLNFIIWPIPFLLKVHLPQRITLEMVHLITCARDG